MTPEEYEAAFHGIDLPETLELATGVTVSDVPEFIKASIFILKTSTSNRVKETVCWRLDKALKIIQTTEL